MSYNNKTYGGLLRESRVKSGKTLKDIAEFIGVSVPYLSDVELENRKPLATNKNLVIAKCLGLRASLLLVAAAHGRGEFTLKADHQSPYANEVGAKLMKYWDDFGDDDFVLLSSIIDAIESNK